MRALASRLHLAFSALVASALAAAFAASAAVAAVSVETDTDRMGSDYSGYDLSAADPELCRKACEDECNGCGVGLGCYACGAQCTGGYERRRCSYLEPPAQQCPDGIYGGTGYNAEE